MPTTDHRSDVPDTLDLAAQLRAVVVPLARSLRQQSGGRLTATQASVLGSVMRHGPMAMSAVAVREQLSLPMVSKVVAALEEEGLVRRDASAHDGRVNLVSITEDGRGWVAETRRRRDRWLADQLGALEVDDLLALDRAIRALEQVLDTDG